MLNMYLLLAIRPSHIKSWTRDLVCTQRYTDHKPTYKIQTQQNNMIVTVSGWDNSRAS